MWLLLPMNIICLALVWRLLHQKRKIIGFHTGMNIVMSISGFFSLLIGFILISFYPYSFLEITMVTMIIGGIAGGLFGGLFEYQTFLMGTVNGLMTGLMAPMIGSVIQQEMFLYSLQALFLFLLLFIQYMVVRT